MVYLDDDGLKYRMTAYLAERSKAADSRSAGATRARSNRAVGIPFYNFFYQFFI